MPHPKIVHTHYTQTFLVPPRSLQGTTNDCIPTTSVRTPSQLANLLRKGL